MSEQEKQSTEKTPFPQLTDREKLSSALAMLTARGGPFSYLAFLQATCDDHSDENKEKKERALEVIAWVERAWERFEAVDFGGMTPHDLLHHLIQTNQLSPSSIEGTEGGQLLREDLLRPYVNDSGPDDCPLCDGTLTFYETNYEGGETVQQAECDSCGRNFIFVYRLDRIFIETTDEEDEAEMERAAMMAEIEAAEAAAAHETGKEGEG